MPLPPAGTKPGSWSTISSPAGSGRSLRSPGTLLSRASEYDAVIWPNDILSISLIKLCKSLGIRVPDDLYVASFGNTAVGRLYSPSITTMTLEIIECWMAHLDKLDLLILAELMDGTSYENVCGKLFLSQFYGTNPFRRALMPEKKQPRKKGKTFHQN